ncbi:hypothetical protein HPP92_028577 [Vanilla planifolia]|uniref:Uncharacterized protein n=1 Tax=Vanilla planifolia TaxID=51239 RepID=A0A835P5M8_VANPL|nr:hypothetical protein HPP92_028577 [Vanilla planifolia]
MYSVCKPFFVDVIPLVDVYKVIEDMLKEMTVKEVLGLTSMELSYAYDEMYTKGIINCSHARHHPQGDLLLWYPSRFLVVRFLPKAWL